jgi:hypothetical protein
VNELEKQLGPEYLALVEATMDVDPNSKEGEEIESLFDRPGRGEAPSLVSRYKLVFTQYLSAEALVIFRRTASTSDRPPVSFKATSPKLANSGRVVNEPDDAIIATAIVAARANRKRIDDPIPWDQFDTNDFQHR